MIRLLFALALVSACGKNDKPPPPTSGSPGAKPESGPGARGGGGGDEAALRARTLFEQTCSMCHGANGKGDGQMAAQLNPRPRDYTDPTWQASVTDDDIKKTILEGGAAVGKSGSMPSFKSQVGSKPEVLDELVKIIRGFAKK